MFVPRKSYSSVLVLVIVAKRVGGGLAHASSAKAYLHRFMTCADANMNNDLTLPHDLWFAETYPFPNVMRMLKAFFRKLIIL